MRIEDYKDDDEMVLWKGKPNKAVYIKERIFTPLALFALIWLLFESVFVMTAFSMPNNTFQFIIIPFMAFHLMPVWLYIGSIIFSVKSWSNTNYMVTDRAVYITSGVFTTNCNRKTFQEITNVSVHQGIIDKTHNVGDVYITTGQVTYSNGRIRTIGINIIDIDDYMKVYKIISKTSRDIYSDTMYPNDLRPEENHGYKTKYVNDYNDEKDKF